jgi:hypothetical protein
MQSTAFVSPQGEALSVKSLTVEKRTEVAFRAGEKSRFQESVDRSDASMKEIYKSLTAVAEEVLRKLEKILGKDLPGGISSLVPEEHTAEKTSQRIVDGVTALLPVFAKQNPELEGAELLNRFMETIRGGIDQGYTEAMGILGDIGALDFEGVESGIAETMRLVDEKLKTFADSYLKQVGVEPGMASTPDASQAASIPGVDAIGVQVLA